MTEHDFEIEVLKKQNELLALADVHLDKALALINHSLALALVGVAVLAIAIIFKSDAAWLTLIALAPPTYIIEWRSQVHRRKAEELIVKSSCIREYMDNG